MQTEFRHLAKKILNASAGFAAVGLLRAIRHVDRKRMANFAGRLMRTIGPWLAEHRVGRSNLTAAFPDKSSAEIEDILAGVWDNLGRVAVEVAHLDRMRIEGIHAAGPYDITNDRASDERYERIIRSGRPTLNFAAHLANWEIPAVEAAALGMKSAALYQPLHIGSISDSIIKLRAATMGTLVPTGLGAPVRLARLLESGVHVGMLVDQHNRHGKQVDVTFFGRPCKVNPLIAKLARETECPIHGVRVVRLPDGNRFFSEITDAIEPPRDRDGRIDIAGTMQAITSVIEGWIREHPEQWLWLHRRWR